MSPPGTSDAANAFSLLLRQDGVQVAPILLAATLRRPGLRHRLTFNSPGPLSDVLAPDLARVLATLCADLPCDEAQARRAPTEEVVLPALVLGGLTLHAARRRGDGTRAISIHFRYFVGGVQAAFSAETGFDRPTLAQREELGIRALDDVARPLLDIAGLLSAFPNAASDPAMRQGMARGLAGIEAQASDLEFYAGLLRRYVGECDPARAARFDEHDTPLARVQGMSEPPLPAFRHLGDG